MRRGPEARVGTGFLRRACALSRKQDGFSLVETVVAIGTIFVSLTALAYTGTSGFRYIALARERQAANQIADKLMENTRGLAFSKIQDGLLTSELSASDPYLVTNCAGDSGVVYRFKTCSGEKVVMKNGLGDVFPLVPHAGTIPHSASLGYPVDYLWRTYVTNNDPSRNPYRVTVIVTWSGGGVQGTSKIVQIQSLFWSPEGCTSPETHPFSAPCQPFFFGQASAAQGQIIVSAGPNASQPVQGTTFSGGTLYLPQAESDLQIEQVPQVQSAFVPTGVSLTDANGEQTVGAAVLAAAADGDPSGGAPESSTAPLTGTYLGVPVLASTAGGTVAFSGDTDDKGQAAGDTGQAVVTVTAHTSPPWCPPVDVAALEQDGQPCGGSAAKQGGILQAYANLNGYAAVLGRTQLVRVSALGEGQNAATFVNRTTSGTDDGTVTQTVHRAVGDLGVGGLPASFGTPSGWQGYFIRLTGYSDRASATVGANAATPVTDAAIEGGTLEYWNGSQYVPVDLTSGFLMPPVSVTMTDENGNAIAVVTMSGQAAGATTPLESAECPVPNPPPNPLPPPATCSASVSVTPPLLGSFNYSIAVNGSTVVNLSIALDLGTILAKGTYQRAPSVT